MGVDEYLERKDLERKVDEFLERVAEILQEYLPDSVDTFRKNYEMAKKSIMYILTTEELDLEELFSIGLESSPTKEELSR